MTLPKYLQEKSVKEISVKQEKRVTRQLNSGSLWFSKADLKSDECLFELKGTKQGGKQIIVTHEILQKIFKEANEVGKTPILILEIGEFTFIGEVIKRRS